jgi:hypothetical protein
MGALLRQVANDDLALDQLDHERLGSLAAGLATVAEVRDLGRRHALQPDVDAAHDDGVAVDYASKAR